MIFLTFHGPLLRGPVGSTISLFDSFLRLFSDPLSPHLVFCAVDAPLGFGPLFDEFGV